MEMLSMEAFKLAKTTVDEIIYKTSLIRSDFFSSKFGYEVYVKPENIQLTGAYKIRGAYFRLSLLNEEEKNRGLVAASAGNHAQGVALAAQKLGIKAHIVMPTTTPLMKINNTKAYGAEVILEGDSYDDACSAAMELAEKKNYTFIHPFNDKGVATGQASIAFEILESLPEVDVILVPVGGGGLATGISTLAKMLKPEVKVIAVEPEGAASLNASLKAGKVVELASISTIADGVAVKRVGEDIFPYLKQNIDEVITVPDEELVGVFLDMLEQHKMLVENAGLLPMAALRHLKLPKGTKVCCVLSGGNMDVITMSSLVQHGLIRRERIFSFSVLLPDRPGELENIARIVAKHRGNIIKLDHNQFVSINRSAAVELKVTLEAFGSQHKQEIMTALAKEGYRAEPISTRAAY